MKQNLVNQENWVVVEIPNLVPHYFKTFNEALNNPIKGHLMTETYYKYHYEQS
jgi:hypothetical protein